MGHKHTHTSSLPPFCVWVCVCACMLWTLRKKYGDLLAALLKICSTTISPSLAYVFLNFFFSSFCTDCWRVRTEFKFCGWEIETFFFPHTVCVCVWINTKPKANSYMLERHGLLSVSNRQTQWHVRGRRELEIHIVIAHPLYILLRYIYI